MCCYFGAKAKSGDSVRKNQTAGALNSGPSANCHTSCSCVRTDLSAVRRQSPQLRRHDAAVFSTPPDRYIMVNSNFASSVKHCMAMTVNRPPGFYGLALIAKIYPKSDSVYDLIAKLPRSKYPFARSAHPGSGTDAQTSLLKSWCRRARGPLCFLPVIAFLGATAKNHFLRTSGIRFDTEYSPKRVGQNLTSAGSGGRPKIKCVARTLSDQITPDQFSLGSGKRRMFPDLPITMGCCRFANG